MKRSVIVNGEDEDLFSQEMSDVEPLKREPRVKLSPGIATAKDSSLEERRSAAVADDTANRNPLSDTQLRPLDSWFVLEFKRPGVQNGVYRKLKQGRYEAEARLDLHRMTVKHARREVFEFFQESLEHGLRSVIIIHGKGENRVEMDASGVLKAFVNHWLRELDMVQAFHSAQPRHGGTGAVYVLLRKSEAKKREAREKFSKGRIPYEGS